MARILLMEDDFVLARDYADWLEDAGHTVSIAINATEALALAQEIQFDLAVVDIFVTYDGAYVPDGGISLIGKLRSGKGRSMFPVGGPIIAISGATQYGLEAPVLEIALQVGADHKMTKPIDMNDLCDLIDDLTGSGQGNRSGGAVSG